MKLNVKELSFAYEDKPVLNGISFSVDKGEFVSVLGPNGAGKSTLFRCILGLQKGYDGVILIDGVSSREFSSGELAKRVAYIPQSSRSTYNFSVIDIVLMGSSCRLSPFSTPGPEERERCMWSLEKIGIADLAHRCFHRLSGGEQQLVMIARALTQNAPILLMDEPTASLDYGNQLLVMQQAKRLTEEGYSIIQTTHNPEQSYLFSDRILAMHNGTIILDGNAGDVLTPKTMQVLYGVSVDVVSVRDDKARACVPLCL